MATAAALTAGSSAEIPADVGLLSPAQLRIAAPMIALATFMQVLDTTIANVSLPTIAGDLGASTSQGTWVITSFAVANGICVPMTGWLAGRFGSVRTFVGALVLFTLASWLCGMAWSLESLIAFRVLQGAVSGPMIPLSQSLLMYVFPRSKSGTGLAIWSLTTLVAPVCGPLLGGYISDNTSWRWIFLLNVPVGFLAAAVTWAVLKTKETPTLKLPVDLIGIALLIVWVGSLQLMLDRGRELDWFASPEIVALALIAGFGCVIFIVWELTEKHPIVDLTLFRSRNFVIGCLAICLGFGIYFANVVMLPLWLQTQVGYTATWAGLVSAPTGILAIICSPIVGKNIGRWDPRRVATISFAIFALACWLRSSYTLQATAFDFALPQFIQGVAMATFFVPLIALIYTDVSQARYASASGMANFLRATTGSFFASLATTFWDRRAAVHQTDLVAGLDPNSPLIAQVLSPLSQTCLVPSQQAAVLMRNVSQQAYFLSIMDFFYLSAIALLCLIPLVWLARRPKPQAGIIAAAD
jgi:MFS transporter, DHA2 family, multidrug resistance protein